MGLDMLWCRGGTRRSGLKKWMPVSVGFAILIFAVKRLFYGGDIYMERIETKADSEIDFERLLYYIQHPQTLCSMALTLGGTRDNVNRIDGDKIICHDQGPLKQPCIVYSFGGNDEWSFEEDVVRFGCEVYTFDPSLKIGKHRHGNNMWFYPMGISNFNEDRFLRGEMRTWRMRTLDYLMEWLGHQNRTLDVLKMDIEGDEWKVIEDILDKKLFQKIRHLCVEVHLHTGGEWTRKLHLLNRLEEEGGMRLFSSRKNLVTKDMSVPGLPHRKEQLFYELAWYRERI